MTDHTNVVYAENESNLPWQIMLSVVYDKNQTGK